MSRPRRLVACLTASLLLAAPGAALAQSAGDDQYSDPLAGSTSQSTTPSTTTPSSSNGLGQTPPSSSGSSSGSGSGSASGSNSGSSGSGTTTTPGTATTPSSSGSLPNTGFDARLVAALGAAMLLGGAGLRLRARGADR